MTLIINGEEHEVTAATLADGRPIFSNTVSAATRFDPED